MRLEGKVALVTGAGSGFGEGIARRFGAEGARVTVNDIDGAAADRVAAAIAAAGDEASAAPADVATAAGVAAMIGVVTDRYGRLDILVNNAGVPQRKMPLTDVPEDVFDRIFAVNVKAIYLAARAVVPLFRAQGGGVILNTASTAAVRPRPGLTWYNASKGAVTTLTRSMAAELAADGIRVNALNPVAGDTPMLAEFLGGTDTPEARAEFIKTVPMGRLSTATDVANAALFLVSDEAEFITGVCLEVDGGRVL